MNGVYKADHHRLYCKFNKSMFFCIFNAGFTNTVRENIQNGPGAIAYITDRSKVAND